MGFTNEVEKKLIKDHHDLCKALNVDKVSSSESWKTFKQVFEMYVLEGEPIHWLGCALYVACKTSTSPTVSKSNVVVQGNMVSLVRLLRIINLSLIDFFLKISKWIKLQEIPPEICESINKLERNFHVSMILFKKFQPIFDRMFKSVDLPKLHKGKKSRPVHPEVCQVFEFTWTLFLCIKSNFPKIVDDLVNSYHLLLACCDFIYANAIHTGRRDLNVELMTTHNKNKFEELSDLPCVLDKLCEIFDGIPVEAKSIKEYCWRKQIKLLFEKKVLKGNPELLCEILDIANFEANSKAINKQYEEFVLSVGTVDERVFIGYHVNDSQSNRTAKFPSLNNVGDLGDYLDAKRKSNLQTILCRNSMNSKGKEISDGPNGRTLPTMYSSKSGPSLRSQLISRPAGPSEYLKKLKCLSNMEQLIGNLSSKLYQKLIRNNSSSEISFKDAENIKIMVIKMYYKLVDSIYFEEIKKPSFDPNLLLSQEIFIKTLFACAAEIIFFTMNLNFPWLLEVVELTPFHYYRIIEVVVRNEDALKRDVVKHLNVIEESILESLAWQSDSPLWKAIIDSSQPVPSCEDVTVRVASQEEENSVVNNNKTDLRVDKLETLSGKTSALTNSPGIPLADKFLSPLRPKRPLTDSPLKYSNEEPPNKFKKTGLNNENINPSNSYLSGARDSEILRSSDENNTKAVTEFKKPKRTGSVPLFFRKFYYLASIRLKDLCDQLGLTDLDLRAKIWTCFEMAIVSQVSLMLDRHLDQLLMCSIYVICKIVEHDLTFLAMMKCYRNQSQAQSHVYRQVLLSPNRSLDELKASNYQLPSNEERGDIIKFYNQIYVHKVKEFAIKFRTVGENDRLVLSPIPIKRGTPLNGPKRVTDTLPIYISGAGKNYMSPNSKPFNYYFAQSPRKDLHVINAMVSHEIMDTKISKKLLDADSSSSSVANASMSRKVKDLYAERMTMTTQEISNK